ncbi:transporter substrate-binding domain-containing protein [Cyclobacterium sp. 1_MG-2023]|uniref:transglycosylase SLT domain-containing protein n=1 Tax=Cyclobacterium sp. 1_MG-2023 TaxID=3062681 RepID=UPI0026E351BF|nr:transporter substrate-binding domain-containing protein [Cyclobacterium sp. 1_MG-2023]MDO6439814.1 transporter substrate-binding domain-containing protein [Cyclobacterium sp. 1_MG-2023]
MPKTRISCLLLLVIAFELTSCKPNEEEKKVPEYWESPAVLDFDAIKKRGFIRAVVDNSSTSYYIYRGRTMGYEFELLRNLANQLGVNLRLIVKHDLEDGFRLLNKGKADIVAINFEVNEERKKRANFTAPLNSMKTVVVQRKDQSHVDSLIQLSNKKVYIKKGTIYKERLSVLSDSLSLSLAIEEKNTSLEDLINQVIEEKIDYTVVDNDIALVNATYNDLLDVSLTVSQPNPVAWAIRKNAPQLEAKINEWIERIDRTGYKAILYHKYFLNKKNSYHRSSSAFSSVSGDRISAYDDIIKQGADKLGWDWRLLAALVYKESRFNHSAVSYAGAVGLLQLMPVTLQRFGVNDPNNPNESLRGGVNYLKYLDGFWLDRVPDNNERIKFILASYNVGHGHVQDAWRLAYKYGKDNKRWKNVAYYLERKSKPEVYRDPWVKSGYAKGHVTVRYVREVYGLYESYKVLVAS